MNPHLRAEMMRAHNADLEGRAAQSRPERASKMNRLRAYSLRRTFQLPVPRHA